MEIMAERDYTDFEPESQWVQGEASDTLLIKLPGFSRNQLKVQVTSTSLLRIFGERQIDLNTYTRFRKEFPLPPHYDVDQISAQLEAGQLLVKLPKLVTPPAQEVPSEPREEKTEAKGDEVISQEAAAQKDKEQPSDQTAEGPPQKKKVRTDGPVETVEALGISTKPTTERTDTRGASKVVQRLKTHLLDLTQTIIPSGADDVHDEKELAAPAARQSKKKKLLNLLVAILMFVVLGLYVKNAIRSSARFKFQEL